ncbi:MAG: hypothetical protein ABTQ25_11105 [Nitrosomonas ureae]|jgi:hypothetical protein
MLKLLDYGKQNPFNDTIGRPRKLAWPVSVYRVTLPRESQDKDGLNAFEHVVLKLLDACGAMDASELALETCIPLDLVKGILLRLQDKEHIDEYNFVIKREGEENANEGDIAPVFATALMFRELATGKILPFLHWLSEGNPLLKKEGREKDYRTVCLNDIHFSSTPTERDVIQALRAMKKRMEAFGIEYQSPAIKQIKIFAEPGHYHLDCPIAIKKSDSEFRIADPFGCGFSLILEGAFEELLERDDNTAEWLLAWKQQLRTPYMEDQGAKLKELFETEANLRRYPKLIANLRPSGKAQFRNLANIYASIEWALFYSCCVRPFKNPVAILRLSEQSQHPVLLEQAAESIGLEKTLKDFRPIRAGKLLKFEEGEAELETVLAISILQAQGDALHPLRRIGSAHPDLISRLLKIHDKRGAKNHGMGGVDAPQSELSDDKFMRKIVHILIPEITFADTPVATQNLDARADALLDARASIQSEFGFKQFNRLGVDLQDRLILVERFWQGCNDGDDALGFVVDLYAATQARLHQALAGLLPPDINDGELVATAREKSLRCGFGDLPDSLRTVRPGMISEALQGRARTLGACVMAFLLMSDDESLCAVAASQPSFIADMGNIIALRGHGNEPRPLPKVDIEKLRRATYKCIGTLTEA